VISPSIKLASGLFVSISQSIDASGKAVGLSYDPLVGAIRKPERSLRVLTEEEELQLVRAVYAPR